jgi:hypothetical protein
MKYPVGPETMKEAAKTTPGQLAILLNRVLYMADYKTTGGTRRWVAEDVTYKGDDTIPPGMQAIPHRDKYFDTEQLMLAIRDYLEFRSLEEVIP